MLIEGCRRAGIGVRLECCRGVFRDRLGWNVAHYSCPSQMLFDERLSQDCDLEEVKDEEAKVEVRSTAEEVAVRIPH